MKRIGLIGGMTPESTKDYYSALIELGRTVLPGNLNNPEIIIYSINLQTLVDHVEAGEPVKAIDMLVHAIDGVAAAGADFAAMTANTPHIFLDDIRKKTDVPLISILDTTYARARRLGCTRPLLLGTATTMTASMYPDKFLEGGMNLAIPDENERAIISRSIENELSIGVVSDITKKKYLDICGRHIEENGIDAVILGCTEIPMILKENDLRIPVLDTLRIHAEALFKEARS
ncbi:MAG: amino acid racemase [Proteobacteria bacterium]|nr:amino acid racemase [Pseudomonadota bacterium]